jgi:hypothetical protein
MSIDYSKVDPAIIEKVKKWDANKPDAQQVSALHDLQAVLEHLVITMTEGHDSSEETTKSLGAILVDIRESIKALNDKETPTAPDYTASVVTAVNQLERKLSSAIAAVDVRPEFTPNINVDAPKVTVTTPKIDLSGVEKILKNDLPQALATAIEAIPEAPDAVDISPLTDILTQMSEKLSSIDTASRMKPQAPSQLKVTNPDGSLAGAPFIDFQWDFFTLTQTTLTDVYVFYLGDASILGKRMKTVTITYTDSGKLTIYTVGKTA